MKRKPNPACSQSQLKKAEGFAGYTKIDGVSMFTDRPCSFISSTSKFLISSISRGRYYHDVKKGPPSEMFSMDILKNSPKIQFKQDQKVPGNQRVQSKLVYKIS